MARYVLILEEYLLQLRYVPLNEDRVEGGLIRTEAKFPCKILTFVANSEDSEHICYSGDSIIQKQLPACKSCLASSAAAAWSISNDSSLLAEHNDTIRRLKLPDVSEIKSSSNVLPYTAIVKYHKYIEEYIILLNLILFS